jgi:hypothetical protein
MRAITPSTTPNAFLRQGRRRLTPRSCAAGAGGATTVEIRVSAAIKQKAYDSNSPKVHCREGHLAIVQIKPEILTLLGLRKRRPGNGLSTPAKYLRRTTSGSAGNGLGTTIKYLRRITNGAAGNGLGATIKYLNEQRAAPQRTA